MKKCLKQVIKLNKFVQTRKSKKRNTVFQPNINNNIFYFKLKEYIYI